MLRLRDPDEFIAGDLHTNPNAWELILKASPVSRGDSRLDSPLSGGFFALQFHFRSDLPLSRRFVNHASCKRFSEFVSLKII